MALPDADTLTGVITPILQRHGADLEGLKVNRAGAKSAIRILADRDGGLDLDRLEQINRELGEAFDVATTATGASLFGETPYQLEVSTPGVEAPLTAPRHFRRNRGRLVRISREGEKPIVRRLGALGPEEREIILIGKARTPIVEVAAVDSLVGAVVEIEFSPAPAAEAELAALDFAAAAELA